MPIRVLQDEGGLVPEDKLATGPSPGASRGFLFFFFFDGRPRAGE